MTLGGVGVWWLIDWIMILSGSYKDKWGKFVVEWKAEKKPLIITLSFIGFFILIFIIGKAGGNSTTSKISNAATTNNSTIQKEDKKVETIKVSAIQIYNDYKENEVSADNKYKDKLVDVSGEVDKIGKDFMDVPYVSLVTLKNEIMDLSMVQCKFDKDKMAELASLKKGTRLIIRGTVNGSVATIVQIEDCEILK